MTKKGFYLILFCALTALQPALPLNAQTQEKEGETVSHKIWGELLARHVNEKGNVNYIGFREDLAALDEYLAYLSTFTPDEGWAEPEILAFYINLYNAATVRLILKHYPVNSIRDIKQPWARRWILVGEEELSLNQIEHKILRKMKESRIHFAINCASASCPKLLNIPFEANKIEQQLQQVTRDFINDPVRNKISPNEVALSALFKWYKRDFTGEGALLDYIRRFSDETISSTASMSYLKYDWSLNEQE